jgi:hypothetical protein
MIEYVAIQPDENFNFTIEPDENINDFSQSDDASTVAARQKNCAAIKKLRQFFSDFLHDMETLLKFIFHTFLLLYIYYCLRK